LYWLDEENLQFREGLKYYAIIARIASLIRDLSKAAKSGLSEKAAYILWRYSSWL